MKFIFFIFIFLYKISKPKIKIALFHNNEYELKNIKRSLIKNFKHIKDFKK